MSNKFSLENFGSELVEIEDLDLLKDGRKVLKDMDYIFKLEQELEKKREDLYAGGAGKKAYFAFFLAGLQNEQVGFASSKLLARLKQVKAELGIVDKTPEEIANSLFDIFMQLVEAQNSLKTMQTVYAKNPTNELSSKILEATRLITLIGENFKKQEDLLSEEEYYKDGVKTYHAKVEEYVKKMEAEKNQSV